MQGASGEGAGFYDCNWSRLVMKPAALTAISSFYFRKAARGFAQAAPASADRTRHPCKFREGSFKDPEAEEFDLARFGSCRSQAKFLDDDACDGHRSRFGDCVERGAHALAIFHSTGGCLRNRFSKLKCW
jgi:hypothetical protein